MTWTPAAGLVNADFASSGTGWTVVTGTPRYTTLTIDGIPKTCFNGASGASNNALVSISQTLVIPADTKKARVTTWFGGSFTDYDAGVVSLILLDGSANIVGGVCITQVDATVFYQEAILECIVPSTAVTATLLISGVRQGSSGQANNGVVSEAFVDWFIDAGHTVYTAPNFLVNGTFETGNTLGWSEVSGTGIEVVSAGTLLIAGAYSCIPTPGVGFNDAIQSRMTATAPITFIPPTAQGVYLTGLSDTNQSDVADSCRARLEFFDENGVLLDTYEQWLQMGNIGIRQWTVWVDTLPVGTTSIEVDFDFWMGATGTACNASIDNVELHFFSESAPVDISPLFQVRLENDTWFNLSPRFTGPGTSGWVKDPGSALGYVLSDSGDFIPMTGGGSAGIMIGSWGKDAGTTNADPGTGDFTFNTTDFTTATAMYISEESSDGLNLATVLALCTGGAQLYLTQIDDPSKGVLYQATATVDNGTWSTVTIAYVDHIGTFFDDNALIGLLYIPAAPSWVIPTPGTLTNPPYSMVFDEPVTNLMVNPKFQNNVTDGWTSTGTVTRARNTTEKFLGDASMSLATTAIDSGATTTAIPITASSTYVFSAWLKGAVGGENCYMQLAGNVTPATNSKGSTLGNTFVTNTWQRFRWFITLGGSDATLTAAILSNTAAAQTIYVSGVQIERTTVSASGEIAPSAYCDGSMGQGHAWTGTPDNSTSTRTGQFNLLGPMVASEAGGFTIRPDGSIGGKLRFRTDWGTWGAFNSLDEPQFAYEFVGGMVTTLVSSGMENGIVKVENTANGIALYVKSGVTTQAGFVMDLGSLTSGTGLAIYAPADMTAMAAAGGKFLNFADKSGASAYQFAVEYQLCGNNRWPFNMRHQLYGAGSTLATISAALAGTISSTAGSPIITGVGTTFLADIQPGDFIYTGAGSIVSDMVLSVQSNTQLTLTGNAPFAPYSGQAIRRANRGAYRPPRYVLESPYAAHPQGKGGFNYSIWASGFVGQLHVKRSATPDASSAPTADGDGDALVTRKYARNGSVSTGGATTEVELIGFTIPERMLAEANKVLRINFSGTIVSSSGAHTLTFRVKVGGVTLVGGVGKATGAAETFHLEGCITIMATGTGNANATIRVIGRSTTTATTFVNVETALAVAVELRIQQAFSFTVQSSNAGTRATTHSVVGELV